ncbi:MAG: flagellar biosynthesis protein FlhB [Azospirillaceae bacterium]|nr:flagellar biosynthesis protein FlhB [Azospirillaceae bacterium]
MAEDDDDASKTEDPSAKKLEDARSRGSIPKSKEVDQVGSLLAGLVVITLFLPGLMGHMRTVLAGFITTAGTQPTDVNAIGALLEAILIDLAKSLGLLLATTMLAAYLPGALQTGFMFSTESLAPDLMRLNPFKGITKIFSTQNVFETLKSMVKATVIGILVFFLVKPMIDQIAGFIGLDAALALLQLKRMVVKLVIGVIIGMIVLAAADAWYQNFQFIKQLRMTKHEVKEEYKQTEGDPMIKARLRGKRMERARRRMMAAVPKATVIVTNPTHFAIALKYEPPGMKAPLLVAKGSDLVAKRIRDLAEEHQIPIVENPPLARALYASVDIDQEIPHEHYRAVAEVISFVFKMRKSRGAR